MILFTDCKINLGLYVTARRPDGYHDIETVMYPVPWHDVLELVPATSTSLTVYGRPVACPTEKNLVMRAHRAMEQAAGRALPVAIGLHKAVPDGAGLGGGSADAAYMLRGLNELFGLEMDDERLEQVASAIGADCPFFVRDRPALCTGTGTAMDHGIDVDLAGWAIVVAKPRAASVSTAEAYAAITPQAGRTPLAEILALGPEQWRGRLTNDFQPVIEQRVPQVADACRTLYGCGAVYAAMSGSGSAVYGLFATDIMAQTAAQALPECDTLVVPARAQ